MDQLVTMLSDFAFNFFNTHPKLASSIVLLVVLHTVIKSVVDSLVSSRAQWDATPNTDDNWYEKALTTSVRVVAVLGKAVAYLAGFRPKAKAEIKLEQEEK